MRKLMIHLTWLLPLFVCRAQEPAPGDGTQRLALPLQKRTLWTYSGTVERTGVDTGTERKRVELKAEVLEVVKRGHITAALVRGCPLGLLTSDGPAAECVFVQVGAGLLYIVEPPRAPEVLKRLHDREDELVGLVHESELVIDFPLFAGKKIGETSQLTRQCADESDSTDICPFLWTVTHSGGDGAPAQEYTLTWQGLSGFKRLRFINGIGITGFVFKHGPSGEEDDVDLLAYQPGEP